MKKKTCSYTAFRPAAVCAEKQTVGIYLVEERKRKETRGKGEKETRRKGGQREERFEEDY